MKDSKGKFRVPILAAGGIVLRNDLGPTARLAVIQSRKLETWGLPKGKLAAGEDAMTAARREVLEETGYRVTIHEFLGTLVYDTGSRPKAVQFWRMEAVGAPAGVLMRDVKAVDWLALDEAIGRLSHLRERVFLEQAGPIALRLAGRPARDVVFPAETVCRMPVPGVPLALAGGAAHSDHAGPERDELNEQGHAAQSLVEILPEPGPVAQTRQTETAGWRLRAKHFVQKCLARKTLMEKTWGWLHGAARRRHFD